MGIEYHVSLSRDGILRQEGRARPSDRTPLGTLRSGKPGNVLEPCRLRGSLVLSGLGTSSPVPRVPVADWLGADVLPAAWTLADIEREVQRAGAGRLPHVRVTARFTERWAGHDPLPDLDPWFGIVQVDRWRRVVAAVTDPETEIDVRAIPAGVRYSGRLGDPWYDPFAYVLVPGANHARWPKLVSRDRPPLAAPPPPEEPA